MAIADDDQGSIDLNPSTMAASTEAVLAASLDGEGGIIMFGEEPAMRTGDRESPWFGHQPDAQHINPHGLTDRIAHPG